LKVSASPVIDIRRRGIVKFAAGVKAADLVTVAIELLVKPQRWPCRCADPIDSGETLGIAAHQAIRTQHGNRAAL
jgi:hypothetical protein